MKTRWKILCSLLFAAVLLQCCHGEGGVVINMDVNIQLPGKYDPCEQYACPDDHVCTAVYHPEFLDVPVAHCISREKPQETEERVDPSTCAEIKVGSNVLNCKSLEEWKKIGRTQCSLKTGYDTPLNLTNTKASYTCHKFDSSSNSVYLQAQFTCCPRLPDSSPLDGANFQPQAQTEVPTDSGSVTEDDRRHFFLYPLIIAMATILAVLMILMAVRVRRRYKQRPNFSKPFIATSFVNPSADHEDTPTYDIMDEYNGHSDKCLLVVNEHAQYPQGGK